MEAQTDRKSMLVENVAAAVAASGGSTHAAALLSSIARGYGIDVGLFYTAEVFKRTPYIASLKPDGRFVDKDLFDGENIPLMKTLVDAERGRTDAQLNDAEHEMRRTAWQPRPSAYGSGYLFKYAQQVGSARYGVFTHPGGSAEKTCYADI
jgi:dihydroxyacid dehydratase/phosphogluconate dehydratase